MAAPTYVDWNRIYTWLLDVESLRQTQSTQHTGLLEPGQERVQTVDSHYRQRLEPNPDPEPTAHGPIQKGTDWDRSPRP